MFSRGTANYDILWNKHTMEHCATRIKTSKTVFPEVSFGRYGPHLQCYNFAVEVSCRKRNNISSYCVVQATGAIRISESTPDTHTHTPHCTTKGVSFFLLLHPVILCLHSPREDGWT